MKSSSRPGGCAAGTCCGCASSTTRRRRPRSTARWSWRRRWRSTLAAAPASSRARELPVARGGLAPATDARCRAACARCRCSRPWTTTRPSAFCAPHASTLPLAGEAVVEQWQVSRDLYVILSGAVEVAADGQTLATLGPGEFFGELAAIDWGAGFARTRVGHRDRDRADAAASSSTGCSSTG